MHNTPANSVADERARNAREWEDFGSFVTHDLRTPLLAILGYSQILQEDYQERLDVSGRDYLAEIIGGVERMNRLIDALLEYSRAGREQQQPLEPADVQAIVVQATANLEAAIRQERAAIEVGHMPTVLGDQPQLVEVFQHLIGNAVKFRGDADPVVRVSATEDGDFWRFAVADNGIGIAPEHFDRLFRVFRRLNGAKYPGAGIGLAVCKKIVERHGGRIWLESVPGRGTTFYFTLPMPPTLV